MSWRLVVLRKAIFSSEFSGPFLKKHSQAVHQLPCAAPPTAAGSLLRWHPMRRLGHTVRCCAPPEKAADTAGQACSRELATCEWTLGKPNKSGSSPISVHVKERGVNTLCHSRAYLWPAQWRCWCGSSYVSIHKGVRKAIPVQPPTCLVLLICLLRQRLVKDSHDRLTPSPGVYCLRMEDINHFALLGPYYPNRDPVWPDRKVLTFPTPF